jgi:phage gp36-like protein
MPYATAQDFIDAFGEPETVMLTNLDDAAATTPDLVPLNKALEDATALINAYVGGRYVLPLSVVSTVVHRYCLDIARYMLDRIRSREDVRVRYEDALKFFEQVVKGLVSLGADEITGQNVEGLTAGLGADGARSYAVPAINMTGYGGMYG